jgi:hypothetical protein
MRVILLTCALAACGGAAASPDAPPADAGVPVVPLVTRSGGLGYTVDTAIGDQTFALQIDSGSTTLAVAAATCTTCTGISPTYAPGSDATDEHRTAASEYADMSTWSGEIYDDHVQLVGGPPAVPMAFAAITTQMQFLLDNTSQGILGLGPTDIEEPGTQSVISQLAKVGVPSIIGLQLCTDRGQLWLGGYDASFTAAAPQYSPMLPMSAQDPFYTVEIDDIGIGGTSLGFGSSAIMPTLIDTGASIMVVPQAIDAALTAAVEGSAGFHALFGAQTFAGDGTCLAPTLATTTAAQIDAMLPPISLAMPADGGSGSFTLSLPPLQSYLLAQPGGMYCLWVESVDDVSNTILGPSMLRGFVTIIDVPSKRIGFAPQAGCN